MKTTKTLKPNLKTILVALIITGASIFMASCQMPVTPEVPEPTMYYKLREEHHDINGYEITWLCLQYGLPENDKTGYDMSSYADVPNLSGVYLSDDEFSAMLANPGMYAACEPSSCSKDTVTGWGQEIDKPYLFKDFVGAINIYVAIR